MAGMLIMQISHLTYMQVRRVFMQNKYIRPRIKPIYPVYKMFQNII